MVILVEWRARNYLATLIAVAITHFSHDIMRLYGLLDVLRVELELFVS